MATLRSLNFLGNASFPQCGWFCFLVLHSISLFFFPHTENWKRIASAALKNVKDDGRGCWTPDSYRIRLSVRLDSSRSTLQTVHINGLKQFHTRISSTAIFKKSHYYGSKFQRLIDRKKRNNKPLHFPSENWSTHCTSLFFPNQQLFETITLIPAALAWITQRNLYSMTLRATLQELRPFTRQKSK